MLYFFTLCVFLNDLNEVMKPLQIDQVKSLVYIYCESFCLRVCSSKTCVQRICLVLYIIPLVRVAKTSIDTPYLFISKENNHRINSRPTLVFISKRIKDKHAA